MILEALTRLEPPSGGWKLVAVDNGSTDDTRAVLERYRARLPLTVTAEPRPGKNHAINAGLSLVEGDLVVFTDDDVIPAPDWLVRFRACADANPSCTIFGGPIVARWERTPPDWVRNWVPQGPAFGVTRPDLPDGPVHPGQIFGGNLAVRADVFRGGGSFDPSLGPRGTAYSMGGETQFLLRLHNAGHQSRFLRAAPVEHFVRAHQIERRWLLRRAVRFGRSIPRMALLWPPKPMVYWFGVPRHLFRELVEWSVGACRAALARDAESAFRAQWKLAHAWGRAVEWRAISRERRAGSAAEVASEGGSAKLTR
jgi:glycosyltransferase involved in cell wall biosynthesis